MENPYRSPSLINEVRKSTRPPTYYWGVYFAVGWTVLLCLLMPVLKFGANAPAGSLLPLKLVITFVSLGGLYNLVFIPPRQWKVVIWPIAVVLLTLVWLAWAWLP